MQIETLSLEIHQINTIFYDSKVNRKNGKNFQINIWQANLSILKSELDKFAGYCGFYRLFEPVGQGFLILDEWASEYLVPASDLLIQYLLA